MLVVVVAASAGCVHVVTPRGEGPVRYRDTVTAQVARTPDVLFAHGRTQDGRVSPLRMDVYRPASDASSARPVIVWAHGGGFVSGSRSDAHVRDAAIAFAALGYVSVSIDYRLDEVGCSRGLEHPRCLSAARDATHDAQTAIRYLRANAGTWGIDEERIAIAGVSAGAFVALHVAFTGEQPGPGPYPWRSSRVRAAVSISGTALSGAIDDRDAPTLLFHGTDDELVPHRLAVQASARARDGGVLSLLVSLPGGGHDLSDHIDTMFVQARNFLYHTMGLADA